MLVKIWETDKMLLVARAEAAEAVAAERRGPAGEGDPVMEAAFGRFAGLCSAGLALLRRCRDSAAERRNRCGTGTAADEELLFDEVQTRIVTAARGPSAQAGVEDGAEAAALSALASAARVRGRPQQAEALHQLAVLCYRVHDAIPPSAAGEELVVVTAAEGAPASLDRASQSPVGDRPGQKFAAPSVQQTASQEEAPPAAQEATARGDLSQSVWSARPPAAVEASLVWSCRDARAIERSGPDLSMAASAAVVTVAGGVPERQLPRSWSARNLPPENAASAAFSNIMQGSSSLRNLWPIPGHAAARIDHAPTPVQTDTEVKARQAFGRSCVLAGDVPPPPDQRLILGLVLNADKVTKVLAGSLAHIAGLQVFVQHTTIQRSAPIPRHPLKTIP